MKKIIYNNDTLIEIPVDEIILKGDLYVPNESRGIVIFAHGSGSSRLSPRNKQVAAAFNQINLATLLFDLLTSEEDEVDNVTAQYRFDIKLLAERLVKVTDWVKTQENLKLFKIGYFGASTGAAAALIAAAKRSSNISAVVSRGGRPDLADEYLSQVKAPTLLIVGELDFEVIQLNQKAQAKMNNLNELTIVTNATHLFEEPGALNQVIQFASQWFQKYLLL